MATPWGQITVVRHVLLLTLLWLQGCAVHYYDLDTKTEHVLGLGYVRFKVAVPQEDVQAVIHGVQTLGLGVGYGVEGGQAIVGYRDTRSVEVMPEEARLRVEWPNSNFFDIRIGSQFPFEVDQLPTKGLESTSE